MVQDPHLDATVGFLYAQVRKLELGHFRPRSSNFHMDKWKLPIQDEPRSTIFSNLGDRLFNEWQAGYQKIYDTKEYVTHLGSAFEAYVEAQDMQGVEKIAQIALKNGNKQLAKRAYKVLGREDVLKFIDQF